MAGENKVSLSNFGRTFEIKAVCPPCHDRSYVQSRYRTSALRIFRENLIFYLLSAYSSTPKANKGFLGLPNTNYNLYAKQQY